MYKNRSVIGLLVLVISLSLATCEGEGEKSDPDPQILAPQAPKYFSWEILEDTFQEMPLIIIGSVNGKFMVAYYPIVNGDTLTFRSTTEPLPAIMEDNEGNLWDIFGKAISGPQQGEQLSAPDQFNGFWFAWGTFFPDLEIYNQTGPREQAERFYSEGNWSIPVSSIRDGGVGKDGIPSLTNPEMKSASGIDYLNDDDLVLGINIDGEIRGYPYAILDWHELINEEIGEHKLTITYCPLTGTGIGWDRTIQEQVNSFGVSGLLFNGNLMPYDRMTESVWSQMRMECVYGPLQGEKIKTYPMIEMNWGTWKMMYPDMKTMTTTTGYEIDYGIYPYGDHRTSDNLFVKIDIEDKRLHRKEIVHGIVINDKAKVYRFSDFEKE